MHEAFANAFQTDGLIWLVLAVFVAGMVRGFAGFGSAMIMMPVASSVLSPIAAVVFVMAAELLGPLPNLRAAWREGAPRDVGRLLLGATLALPLGIFCLAHMAPLVFGWVVSICVLVLLALLMLGWRYSGNLTHRLTVATGGLGGFMAGFSGIPGPPVIMLYMSSKLPIAVIRANFLLYLLGIDFLMIAGFYLTGLMLWKAALLGLMAGIPNVVGNMIGARMFDPNAERLFRTVAYLVIAASAMIGLPIWQ
ncbi:MAG: sulfite exporter TauE/SafE family protein [Sulfitobacter sp.]